MSCQVLPHYPLQFTASLLLPLHLQFVLLFAANLGLKYRRTYIQLIAFIIFLLAAGSVRAQYKVQGTVYDSSRNYPLEAVSVLSTGGKGTATDANGHYTISVAEKDSIWFSYLGKPTIKFPVLKITDVNQFDISLRVNVTTLKDVKVLPRNYRQDSIQNRIDYAKVFNYQKPNISTMTSMGPAGAGIDVDEVIRAFQFKKNRSMQHFQARLLQEERDKYVDHRFSKALVRRLTNLQGDELDKFMQLYRPSYELTLHTSDYDFQSYIKECFEQYRQQKGFTPSP